jgi:hypothetical protein
MERGEGIMKKKEKLPARAYLRDPYGDDPTVKTLEISKLLDLFISQMIEDGYMDESDRNRRGRR